MPKGTRASRKKKKEFEIENDKSISEPNFAQLEIDASQPSAPPPVQVVPMEIKPKLGPDDVIVKESEPNVCTVIPFNCSIEEWTSGIITLQEIPTPKLPRKLPFDIYERAKALSMSCKESKITKNIFFGGDFESIFVVELPGVSYVCLTAVTNKQKLQRNQLLHLLLSGDGKVVPYGNALLLESEKVVNGLRYKGVGRKRAIQLLNKLLQDKMVDCYRLDENIKIRYWDKDIVRYGSWFGTTIAEYENINKWGLDSGLMLEHYKTHRCNRALQHEKKNCPFYHSLADARRSPFQFKYSEERCSFSSTDCPEGTLCSKSHNELEHYYHPNFFRKITCVYYIQQLLGEDVKEISDATRQKNCKGPLCSFYHPEEMTPPIVREELRSFLDDFDPYDNYSPTSSIVMTEVPSQPSSSPELQKSNDSTIDSNYYSSGSMDNSITNSNSNEAPIFSPPSPNSPKLNVWSLSPKVSDINEPHLQENDPISTLDPIPTLPSIVDNISQTTENANPMLFQNSSYPFIFGMQNDGVSSQPSNNNYFDNNNSSSNSITNEMKPNQWGYFNPFSNFVGNIFPTTHDSKGDNSTWRYFAPNETNAQYIVGFLNNIRPLILQTLIEYIKCTLFSKFADEWITKLVEQCEDPHNNAILTNPSLWDFQLCNTIILRFLNYEYPIFRENTMIHDILTSYKTYLSNSRQQPLEREFYYLMFLLKCIKYESKLQNFITIERLTHELENKFIYANPPINPIQNYLYQEYYSSTWTILENYILQPSSEYMYILIGNIPSSIDPMLLRSLPIKLVLDFNVDSNESVDIVNKNYPLIYETSISQCNLDLIDINSQLTWIKMRSKADLSLSNEEYSKKVISGLCGEVLQSFFTKLSISKPSSAEPRSVHSPKIICFTLLNNEDIQYHSLPSIKKHINYCLKILFRFELLNTLFITLLDSPHAFELFKEPVLKRSTEILNINEFAFKLTEFLEAKKKSSLPQFSFPAAFDASKHKDLILPIANYYDIPVHSTPSSSSLPSDNITNSLINFISGSPISWDLLFIDEPPVPKRELFYPLNQSMIELVVQANQNLVPLNLLLYHPQGSGATTLSRQLAASLSQSFPTFFLQASNLTSPDLIASSLKVLQAFYDKTKYPIIRIIDNFDDLEILPAFYLNFPSVSLFIVRPESIQNANRVSQNLPSLQLPKELSVSEAEKYKSFFVLMNSQISSLPSNNSESIKSSSSSSNEQSNNNHSQKSENQSGNNHGDHKNDYSSNTLTNNNNDQIHTDQNDANIMMQSSPNPKTIRRNITFFKENLILNTHMNLVSSRIMYLLAPILQKPHICKPLLYISLIYRYTGMGVPYKYVNMFIEQFNLQRERFNINDLIHRKHEISSLLSIQITQNDYEFLIIHPDVAEFIIQEIMKINKYQYSTILSELLRSTINHETSQYNRMYSLLYKLLYGSRPSQRTSTFSEFIMSIEPSEASHILSIADECFQSTDSGYFKAKFVWERSEKNIQTFALILNLFNDLYIRCTNHSQSLHIFYLLKAFLYQDFAKYILSNPMWILDDYLGFIFDLQEMAISLCQKSRNIVHYYRRHHIHINNFLINDINDNNDNNSKSLQSRTSSKSSITFEHAAQFHHAILALFCEFQVRFEFLISCYKKKGSNDQNADPNTTNNNSGGNDSEIVSIYLFFKKYNLLEYRDRTFEIMEDLEALFKIWASSQSTIALSTHHSEKYYFFFSLAQVNSLEQIFLNFKKILFQLFGSTSKDFDNLSSLLANSFSPYNVAHSVTSLEIRRSCLRCFLYQYRESNFTNTWPESYFQSAYNFVIENLNLVLNSSSESEKPQCIDFEMNAEILLTRRLLTFHSNQPISAVDVIKIINSKIAVWPSFTKQPIVALYYYYITLFIEYVEITTQNQQQQQQQQQYHHQQHQQQIMNNKSRKEELRSMLLNLTEKCQSLLDDLNFALEVKHYNRDILVLADGGIYTFYPIDQYSKVPPDRFVRLRGKVGYYFDQRSSVQSKCILYEGIPILCDNKLQLEDSVHQSVHFNVHFSWWSPAAFGIHLENKNSSDDLPKAKKSKKVKYTKINPFVDSTQRWKGRVSNVDLDHRIMFVSHEIYQIFISEEQFDGDLDSVKKEDLIEFEPKENTAFTSESIKKYKGIKAIKIDELREGL